MSEQCYPRPVLRSDFAFDLPEELIAQEPSAERTGSRLLHLDGTTVADFWFRDLPDLLHSSDLLVFNDTRVLRARLYGRKETGGQVEILIERILDEHRALAQARASKSPRAGARIDLDGGYSATVLQRREDLFELEFSGGTGVRELMEQIGHIPLPPYIRRDDKPLDAERYQTVYAKHPGAVAAPTAGLHFDRTLLDRLQGQGVGTAYVTLHVGSGTFQPVRAERIEDHRMHSEYMLIDSDTCERVRAARETGGRVVAVGTTAARVLESAALSGELQPCEQETDIFIYPGFGFRVVDVLITNFHLPGSTLLMLVCAFAGREKVLRAYRHAVAQRYRFFSYGDAMLISRATDPE